MKSTKAYHLLTHIILIGLGVVWIYPFFWMVLSSLKSNKNYLLSGLNPWPQQFHWENYARAWEVANFEGYFFNTIIMTVSVVLIVVVLSCLTGYPLGRVAFPGRKVIIACVAAITFVPKGYTIIPLYQLVYDMGLADSLLGVIVAESAGAHVLFILLFAAFFSRVPKDMEESAVVDGCGYVRTFARVILPTAKPVIATAVIMQFIWTWSSFLIPLVLTINNPESRTLAVGLLSFVSEYQTDWTGMSAGATISLLPIILIFITMQRYFYEGLSGAVKQ